MKMNTKLMGRTAFLSLVGLLLASSAEARWHPKVTFGAEYIQYYGSDCTTKKGMADLSYADNIMEYFTARMRKYGNRRKFLFGNSLVETTDLAPSWDVRAGQPGKDYLYGDNVEAYAIVAHGGKNYSSNNFVIGMCSSRSWPTETRRKWEFFNSHSARWGDQKMRWALLFVCRSAEEPHLEWKNALGPHFEVLMGFDGLTYTGITTDENLEDWVDNAYDDKMLFKSSWFDANEDWFTPNARASLMAVGDSLSEAIYRRDNQTIYSPKRNGGNVPKAFAWSSKIKGSKEVKYGYTR